MDFDWTQSEFEADARRELGSQFAEVVDHFPRVVFAIYAQMQNEKDSDGLFPRQSFVQQVCAELPKSCAEVLPFFVRSVWNKKWAPETHQQAIKEHAAAFVRIVRLAGGELDEGELVRACADAYAHLA